MNPETELRTHLPKTLSKARAIAHKSVQLLTKAARANLVAVPDDSHSNLVWDRQEKRFLSQPLAGESRDYFIGLSLAPLSLSLVSSDQLVSMLDLNNVSEADATNWLDVRLESVGLNTASAVTLPYDLPTEVAGINIFHAAEEAEALTALSAWFSLAESMLSEFAADKATVTTGPSPVRCWPHHFDIATYVGLQAGDAETAKGIGVGMSPGDENYDLPYFYINPWPFLDTEDLSDLPAPGHWHREGFVGAIATADEVLSLDDIAGKLPLFINGAFAIGRNRLGA